MSNNQINTSGQSILDNTDRFISFNIDKLESSSIKDESDNYELENGSPLNVKEYLTFASPREDLGQIGKRGYSEGRSRSFFQRVKDKDSEKVWNDVLVKGIGGTIKELDRRETQERVNPVKTSTGKEILIRYATGKFMQITGRDYGASEEHSSEHDNEISKDLEEKGLRTRRRFFIGKLKGDTKIATDKGFLPVSNIFDEPDQYPIIEMWLMRCSYRLKDVTSFLADSTQGLASFSSVLSKSLYNNKTDKLERNEALGVNNRSESIAERPEVKEYFKELRSAIQVRSAVDEDERFKALSEIDSDISEQEFYKQYLLAFAGVLGEQIGVMYNLGAYSRDNMFNSQNISLLAEIVDHDITVFNLGHKTNAAEILTQIKTPYISLQKLIDEIHLCGMLPSDFNPVDVLKIFATGIKVKLKESGDLETLRTTLAQIDTKEQAIPEVEKLKGEIQKVEEKISLIQDQITSTNSEEISLLDGYRYDIAVQNRILERKKGELERESTKVYSPMTGKLTDSRRIFDPYGGATMYFLLRLLLD